MSLSKRNYFGTDGIRGLVGQYPITPDFILKLGWAVGRVFAETDACKVLIGKDTRISGYMFESALEAGLSAAGVDIHLLGPMPTPAIAYLTRTFRAQAGIVISASHNPYYDNGIKFFSAQGSKLPDEIEEKIEAQLEQPMHMVASAKLGKAMRIVDAPGRYIEFCKSTIPPSVSLHGTKIVVDCANGATYHVAPDIFRELGAEVIELHVTPDGFNINASCGSTNPDILQKTVVESQAHLGIGFDGDGDRLIMVDQQGELLDGDDLLFIIAKYYFEKQILQGGIVGTIMSNLGLEQALAELNIPFIRAKVGDRYVLEELTKRGWQLGGEPSGHLIQLKATTTGDGIISALQVLAAMHDSGKSLAELKANLYKYPQTMLNIRLKQRIDVTQIPPIQQAVSQAEAELGPRGRVLLRSSGTEPLIRVMVEGINAEQVKSIAHQLAATVEQSIKKIQDC